MCMCFYLSLFDAKAFIREYASRSNNSMLNNKMHGSNSMLTPLLISYQFHRTVISLPYTLKVILHSQYDLGFRLELIITQVI